LFRPRCEYQISVSNDRHRDVQRMCTAGYVPPSLICARYFPQPLITASRSKSLNTS
jgi:hypothetical protein